MAWLFLYGRGEAPGTLKKSDQSTCHGSAAPFRFWVKERASKHRVLGSIRITYRISMSCEVIVSS